MPSARSFYTQKTITTTTTRTKTVPQRQPISWQSGGSIAAPEPQANAVSVQQMHRKLDDVKVDQNKNVVFDTLSALVSGNATAQLLRSRSSSRTNLYDESRLIYQLKDEDLKPNIRSYEERYKSSSVVRSASPQEPEVKYKLRLSSPIYQPEGPASLPTQQPVLHERAPSLEKVCKDFAIEAPHPRSASQPRSVTPISRRLIVLEEPKDDVAPICAYCHQPIYGLLWPRIQLVPKSTILITSCATTA